MHKFPITHYKKFSELPLEELSELKFSIYLIDFNWNYLFINDFVKKNLGKRAEDLIGKNMWESFPELAADTSFKKFKKDIESGIVVNQVVTSPVTAQRLNIIGYPLEDCYYFSSSILPDKEDLINELKNELKKRK